jgi:hypothetical protein
MTRKTSAPAIMASTSDRRPWHRPEPNWLTLECAPFFFAPDYAAPGAAFERQMARTISTLHPNLSFEIRAIGPDIVKASLESLSVTFEGCSGYVMLGSEVDRDINLEDIVPMNKPLPFVNDLRSFTRTAEAEFRNGLQNIQMLVKTFWSERQRLFKQSLELSHASIVGRFGSISAPFSVIEPDQWRYFDVVIAADFPDRSYAKSSLTSEMIFSPLVMPIPRTLPPLEREFTEALGWLISRMQSTQNNPEKKKDLQDIVLNRWPTITDNSFKEKIWPQAKSSIIGNTYGRPGAPRK